MNIFNSDIIKNDMLEIFNRSNFNDRLRNKTFYISGATGMIASYLIYYLIYLNIAHNFNIRIIAGIRNFDKAKRIFGEFIKKDFFSVFDGDISNPILVNGHIDYILHAASLASPQYYGSNPVETMIPNSVGLWRLLELAKEKKVESFLFFSSGAVYGDGFKKDFEESFYGKFDFLSPGSVYGESKRFGEALCKAYYNEFGVPTKSIRIYHTYSPTMNLDNDKRAFCEFMRCAIYSDDIVIHSDGSQKRPYCYIVDGILAIFSVLLFGSNGDSYNLANTNEFISVNELATIICEISGNKIDIIHKNKMNKGYLNLNHTQNVPCSIKKIRDLGCEFNICASEGLRRVYDYKTKMFNDK